MKIKLLLLAGTGIAVVAVIVYVLYSLRAAAEETEASHHAIKAELDCNMEVENAVEIMKEIEKDRTPPSRIVDSKAHFNRTMQACIVEVTRREFGEGKEAIRMLIDPKKRTALLWSVTPGSQEEDRQCFGADAMPVSCEQADARRKAYLEQP